MNELDRRGIWGELGCVVLHPCPGNNVVVQSLCHVVLCHSMDCSTPGFPVLHYLLEFAQTHVH